MKGLRERLEATGQLLVRSGAEIATTLQALCEGGAPITAMLESGEQLFLSRLLEVNAAQGRMVIACSAEKHANSALLAAPIALFACNHEGTHYEFAAAAAQEWEHAGAPALKLALPSSLLALQRRARPRYAVPPTVPLRCLVSLGPLSFEARVVDISTQGVGSILYDPAIRLEPGSRLEGARIVHPQREPIVVDLIVRHVMRQEMPDGSYAARAGCSFVGAPAAIEDLIRLFVTELPA